MAKPIPYAFLAVPVEVARQLPVANLTGPEFQVLHLIGNFCWGKQKEAYPLSYRNAANLTGLTESTARRALAGLITKGVVAQVTPSSFTGPGTYRVLREGWLVLGGASNLTTPPTSDAVVKNGAVATEGGSAKSGAGVTGDAGVRHFRGDTVVKFEHDPAKFDHCVTPESLEPSGIPEPLRSSSRSIDQISLSDPEDPPDGGDGMDEDLLFEFLLGPGQNGRTLRAIIASDDCPVSQLSAVYLPEDWAADDRWRRLELLTGRDRNLSHTQKQAFARWRTERRLRARDCPASIWWPIVSRELRVPGVQLDGERIKSVCLEAITARKSPLQVLEAVRKATAVLTREHSAGKIRGDPANYFDSTLRNELGLPSRKRPK